MSKAARHLKSLFRRNVQTVSFKQFVLALAKEEDAMAKTWLFNKGTSLEKKAKALRWEKKGKLITEQKLATKSSRKRTKASKPVITA